jgi:allantoinase
MMVRSRRVVLPDGIRPATIDVRDGRFVSIRPYDAGEVEIDAGSLVVAPGIVDTHVHVNEPGRTEWEGFEHATRAAAAGGVTTIVDMPLNSIPATTTVAALEAKRIAARGHSHVDVAFWGGVVPGNANDLEPLARAGVRGFKCFLVPSGVDEFEHVTERDLREALPILARLDLPLLAHAELPDHLVPVLPEADPRAYETWLATRPAASEVAAIEMIGRLAREYGARVHVVHLACAEGVALVSKLRDAGVRITAETCPHYLTFDADEIDDGATQFKCAPPIRERSHRERLWTGLAAGDIDLIATDHSPAPPGLKHLADGDFLQAWGGIASLQLGLPAIWSAAAARGIGPDAVSRWLSAAPARLAGLHGKKGAIAAGLDGDLIIWDPDRELTVDAARLHHRHPVTPYHGLRLRGVVHTTILRGHVVFADGQLGERAGGLL